MNGPLVSIIIPCFNVAPFIAEAIRSAAAQTYADIEIIAVDNTSTDDTLAILEGLKSQFDIIVLQESKKGAPAARNCGLRVARGEWIQFLDADDLLKPEKIAHQMALVAHAPSSAIVASKTIKKDLATGDSVEWEVYDDAWHGLLQNRLGITTANLFHKGTLDEIGGWDESLLSSQEYDLMFRMMKVNDQVLVDNLAPLTIIQSRASGSISSDRKRDNQHRFLRLMAEIGGYLRKERPAVYTSLGEEYFQQMFLRIRLNTLDGYPDSVKFYKQLMPLGFRPAVHAYTPRWYRALNGLFGFSFAENASRILRRIKTRTL